MRALPESRGGCFCLLFVFVLFTATHSLSREIEVIGNAESNRIKIPHAFSGLRVTIECKDEANTKDHFVRRGSGELDTTGKFHIQVTHDIVRDDGTLKEACYAQLHSASGNPCPSHDNLEASKIVYLSKSGDKHVLGLKQNLKFSPEVCNSKFFWHMPKLTLPPPLNLPPLTFPKKPCPPLYKPPVVIIPKKPCPPKFKHKPIYKPPVPIYKPPVPIYKPPVPIYKPPVPIYKPPVSIYKPPYKPPVPIYKPPVPIYKPPVPIYKPPVPIYKPPVPIYKPPVPIYKPPYKPPVPIYKPPVPIYKPPVPIYKPPVPIYKPPVPIYKPPVPIYKPPLVIPKKPCPPLPKPFFKHPVPIYKPPLPIYKPIYKPPVVVIPKKPCPPLPKLPHFKPKHFPHPKFGKWPPLPSHP